MNAMLLQNSGCAEKIMKLASNMEAATNCKDVEIAEAVCCAIVSVTIIIVIGSLLWKLMDYLFKGCQEKMKQKYETKEQEWKQKADLLEKKMTALSKDTNAYVKAIDNALEKISASTTKADKKG